MFSALKRDVSGDIDVIFTSCPSPSKGKGYNFGFLSQPLSMPLRWKPTYPRLLRPPFSASLYHPKNNGHIFFKRSCSVCGSVTYLIFSLDQLQKGFLYCNWNSILVYYYWFWDHFFCFHSKLIDNHWFFEQVNRLSLILCLFFFYLCFAGVKMWVSFYLTQIWFSCLTVFTTHRLVYKYWLLMRGMVENYCPEVKLNHGRLLFTEAHKAKVNSRPGLSFTEGTIIFYHSPHEQSIFVLYTQFIDFLVRTELLKSGK